MRVITIGSRAGRSHTNRAREFHPQRPGRSGFEPAVHVAGKAYGLEGGLDGDANRGTGCGKRPLGAVRNMALIVQGSAADPRSPRRALRRLVQLTGSRTSRIVFGAGSGVVVLVLAFVAGRHFAETVWPLSGGHLGLLVAAALLSLLGYTFKAYGWHQLFAVRERPAVLALAAANGGASVTALALPGRFDDVVRIAIVRSFRGCPAGVRTVCLSLFMLGLIDSLALTPFALAAAALPGHSLGVRLSLGLLAVVGIAAGALILALPRVTASRRLSRFRLGRWLRPRTTSLGDASRAWALVSACWATRALGLLLLLGVLGIGFSFTLALLFLCASSAAAALPVGPGGTAMQAGAGAAVLVASGVGVSEAVAVAVAVQTLGMLVGGSIFLCVAGSRAASGLVRRYPWVTVRPLRVRFVGEVPR